MAPSKVYSLVKCAVRVDCATVHAAALSEAAGDFLSHPLRLTMRLHAEELVAATAARPADVTEAKVQGGGACGVQVVLRGAEPLGGGRGEVGAGTVCVCGVLKEGERRATHPAVW